MKRTLASAGAAVLLLITVVTIKWYVWDIVFGQAGSSDRSMLFWGLPVLFVGIFGAIGAAALILVIVRRS